MSIKNKMIQVMLFAFMILGSIGMPLFANSQSTLVPQTRLEQTYYTLDWGPRWHKAYYPYRYPFHPYYYYQEHRPYYLKYNYFPYYGSRCYYQWTYGGYGYICR